MCNKSFQAMGCLTTHLVRHTAVTPMSQADGSCELETQVQKLESKLGELCTQFKTLREDVSQLKSGRLAAIQSDPVVEKVPEKWRVSSPTYLSPQEDPPTTPTPSSKGSLFKANANTEAEIKDQVANECAFDVAKRKGLNKLLESLHSAKLTESNPLSNAIFNNDFDSCITLLKHNLCDREEAQNIRPDILCYVLKHIQQRDAILTSDIEIITELCRLGMDVNRCQCCSKSRMELVMNIGSYQLAEICCEYGAKVTHDNLITAIKGQHIKIIELIKHGAPLNTLDSQRNLMYEGSAIFIAMQNSPMIARLLLNLGATLDFHYSVNRALNSKNINVLKFLIQDCLIVETLEKSETYFQIVESGETEKIQLMLDGGLNVDKVFENKTLLMTAIDTEIIKVLLNRGASVNYKTQTTALINWLSCEKTREIQRTYPNMSKQKLEQKILLTIDLFLKHGAHVNATDVFGSTALIKSSQSNFSFEVLKRFFGKGCG
ncbi:ankyrin repeat and KH domain-containing protein 1 [Biomphalaria pfeifferi]|uniref:Ankyrin repeat and KH domain-containing protein 1 n=1 Tax=Biomphalaria pfeifferi TaxID=112525 RepID=A0AAD8BBE6_BIOPF|nr:ankyrin repeat and KH domain-containing protein 1 [Biomphalaria pfeifferi]